MRHVIAHDAWREFLDSFSRVHDGWLTTIEIIDPDGGVQVEARDKRLTGITSEQGAEPRISILVGGEASDHAGRVIQKPTRVSLTETPAGAHEALEIESTDGATTRVKFRSIIPPELVDGVLLQR